MTILKSKLSGYYFKDFGVWTTHPLDALGFNDEWHAREFVRHHYLDDVQIIEAEVSTPELEVVG